MQFAVPPLCTATPSVQPPPSEPLCRGPSLCTPPSHCVQGPPLCRSPSLCLLQDSLRFCKIPQDSPFGPLRGAVRRAWAPGPPLFFVFVFSYLPVPSRSLVPTLTERLKTLRPDGESTKSPLQSANAADAGALGHQMEHSSGVHHASMLTPQPQAASHLQPPLASKPAECWIRAPR